MKIAHRQYEPEDFEILSVFLTSHYLQGNKDGNWLQPAWEYMHSHPLLDESSLQKIRIWYQDGEVLAFVHYEGLLGEAFFQVRPGYENLKTEMLDYAESNFVARSDDDKERLRVFVNDFDIAFKSLVSQKGYYRVEKFDRPLYHLTIPSTFTPSDLPEGFRLKSLADENDLWKIHRVLWRGFNHPGEPPEEEIEGRRKMQSTPNFRPELTIVVEAPSGHFVSFSGTWYEPTTKIAYVEPVATDPDYRRMGLGRAAVMEGIHRCGELGAEVAYVGSEQVFYKSMGFQKSYISEAWMKHF